VLLHGRGADEHDLVPLLDALDPGARLVGVTARAPLALPPGGRHWYVVRELGYPDPATFLPVVEAAGAWLDTLPGQLGVPYERTVLGGFSQGCVMSWALGLGAGRPRPAGIIALSGFMPSADGFELDLTGLDGYPVAIGHGSFDPVISVEWGRRANERMLAAGADVIYQESPMGHTIDPALVTRLASWLGDLV
jgi:phospholipase/carboxylesterase